MNSIKETGFDKTVEGNFGHTLLVRITFKTEGGFFRFTLIHVPDFFFQDTVT